MVGKTNRTGFASIVANRMQKGMKFLAVQTVKSVSIRLYSGESKKKMDAANWPQLLVGGIKMNWTVVTVTALVCLTLAFMVAVGDKRK